VKLHDLKPAAGSRKERIRVGRGISAGKGKTAGRGTKGQKARAGGKIPAWFEGGQTPAHIRLPKLHGFKHHGRIEYQVVNVGRLSEYAVEGRFGAEPGKDPLTLNPEVLRSAGLISNDRLPVKVLGHGDVTVKLFVSADAFTGSAREKIEAAGGFVQATAPEKVKGETKQDRADARAVIAAEKKKTDEAADAARWAASPAATARPAPTAAPAPAALAADGDEADGADEADRAAEADTDTDAEASRASAVAEAADAEVDADADTDTDEDLIDAIAEDATEDSTEAPASRRRARKTTDSADE
jgi:large subunit ribosomal protein L15